MYNIVITLITNPKDMNMTLLLLLLLDISGMYCRRCGVGNLVTVIYQHNNIMFTYPNNRA